MRLTAMVRSTARALQGLSASPRGLACAVAIAIGTSLSIAEPIDIQAQIMPTTLKQIANYQLTDKQYKCHNEIVFRESRWKANAVGNKQGKRKAYGYYQIKSTAAKGSDDYSQYFLYARYVAHRYGLTQYDEPNYCVALHHLLRKGWQ